jgi:hypothetical protein
LLPKPRVPFGVSNHFNLLLNEESDISRIATMGFSSRPSFKEEADYIFNKVTMIVSAQQIERFESTMKTHVARPLEESTG